MDHKVTFGGKPVTLVGNRCKVGETAPVFTVTDAGLQPVSSDVFHGKVRIYSVFPSVDTPVCSLQNIRFNREASKLGDDVVVVSLSVDLPFAQKRFCAAEGIDRVHVFSDYRELDFGMKYGFVIDSLRLLARGVVVVDRDDVVRYVEYVQRHEQLTLPQPPAAQLFAGRVDGQQLSVVEGVFLRLAGVVGGRDDLSVLRHYRAHRHFAINIMIVIRTFVIITTGQ